MERKMRAALIHEFGGPEKIKTETLPIPEVQEGEVLIRVQAAGVNPVDTAVREGYMQSKLTHQFPLILGWDVAGTVADIGYSARRFEIGEDVYGYARRPLVQYGTYAEYVVLPESYLAHSPQQMPATEAAGIPLAGLTAYQCLFDAAQLQTGQSVLILGASGGVGSMAIQLAKYQQAVVIGVASAGNLAYMQELGADYTIDYKEMHVGEAVKALMPEGVDLILDLTSGETLQQGLAALKPKGKLVSVLHSGKGLDPAIDFHYVFVEPNTLQLNHLADLADSGLLKVHVSQTYSLEEAAEAHRRIQGHHTTGKLVIVP
jgi:NADPH:quinone reductase-like Zn-dependent oxidoreductase